ncbi:hypothetical protein Q5P01_020222 [Channa striata]|uniref:Uncharacterized protein n=1 Tax=Channa striata TaxID=64152 RepID=A0AA88LX95_CHASR|nr:hypothetical protein Q5P01_020222 [Channa striata]
MNWRKSTSVQSRANHRLSGAGAVTSPIHCSPRASPRGAAEAVSTETGFRGCQSEVVLCQLINPGAEPDKSEHPVPTGFRVAAG